MNREAEYHLRTMPVALLDQLEAALRKAIIDIGDVHQHCTPKQNEAVIDPVWVPLLKLHGSIVNASSTRYPRTVKA